MANRANHNDLYERRPTSRWVLGRHSRNHCEFDAYGSLVPIASRLTHNFLAFSHRDVCRVGDGWPYLWHSIARKRCIRTNRWLALKFMFCLLATLIRNITRRQRCRFRFERVVVDAREKLVENADLALIEAASDGPNITPSLFRLYQRSFAFPVLRYILCFNDEPNRLVGERRIVNHFNSLRAATYRWYRRCWIVDFHRRTASADIDTKRVICMPLDGHDRAWQRANVARQRKRLARSNTDRTSANKCEHVVTFHQLGTTIIVRCVTLQNRFDHAFGNMIDGTQEQVGRQWIIILRKRSCVRNVSKTKAKFHLFNSAYN